MRQRIAFEGMALYYGIRGIFERRVSQEIVHIRIIRYDRHPLGGHRIPHVPVLDHVGEDLGEPRLPALRLELLSEGLLGEQPEHCGVNDCGEGYPHGLHEFLRWLAVDDFQGAVEVSLSELDPPVLLFLRVEEEYRQGAREVAGCGLYHAKNVRDHAFDSEGYRGAVSEGAAGEVSRVKRLPLVAYFDTCPHPTSVSSSSSPSGIVQPLLLTSCGGVVWQNLRCVYMNRRPYAAVSGAQSRSTVTIDPSCNTKD